MPDPASQLHPIIARNLDQMGYAHPRPIQARACEPILAGHDVIGLAKTGSGKTAAFLAPIAHHLIARKPRAVAVKSKGRKRRAEYIDPQTRLRALVLCPTRELAQQVADEAARIMQGSVLRVACAYGKVAISPQAQAISRGVDLLVATPGRIRELLDGGYLSLDHVRHVAIDEADRMLDMGFLPQVKQILAAMPLANSSAAAPPLAASRADHFQIILFTSTLPREVEELARTFLRDPVRIEADPHTTPVEHVRQHLLPIDDDDKVEMVLHLVREGNRGGVLVFCRTRRRVGWVNTALQRNDISSVMLHGDMSQAQRTRSLEVFSSGGRRVLVATDVAGRGLHIPAVKTVINYDLPPTPEEYVHRMGRAVHGGGTQGKTTAAETGDVFTLLADDQSEKLRWRAVLDTLGVEVYAESIEGFTPARLHRRAARPPRSEKPARSSNVQPGTTAKPSRREKSKTQKNKRSRKGRPIAKGQKPGRGVIRPKS